MQTKEITASGSASRLLLPRKQAKGPSVAERRKALKLFEQGMGYKAAAKMLGLSANTVRDWARAFRKGKFTPELHGSQYRYPNETRKAVAQLRADGFSWGEISRATGINISTCRNWAKTSAGSQSD